MKDWADSTERLVREAFVAELSKPSEYVEVHGKKISLVDYYGKDEIVSRTEKQVVSSTRGRGPRSSPFVVHVFTEHAGFIHDPMSSRPDQDLFNRVVARLKKEWYVEDAYWDSINAAKHVIHVEPLLVA